MLMDFLSKAATIAMLSFVVSSMLAMEQVSCLLYPGWMSRADRYPCRNFL
jgi:hypothetical protein